MKEQINFNSLETKKQLLKQLLPKLKEVNNHWKNIDDSSGIIGENAKSHGMDENDVRKLENKIAGELASLDFNQEDLTSEDIEILDEYLSAGDNGDLKRKIADKAGIKFSDPFEDDEESTHGSIAAKQILKEIDKNEKLN